MRPRLEVVALVAIAASIGCGGTSSGAPAEADTAPDAGVVEPLGDTAAANDADAPCPSPALLANGSCCPAGEIAAEAEGCRALGPATCALAGAESVLDTPAACEPRWCLTPGADADNQAGLCSLDSGAVADGCPVGQWPDPAADGACVDAGAPDGGWLWTDDQETSAPRRCHPHERESSGCCAPGQWPDPLRNGVCTLAGLPPGCSGPADCSSDARWGWQQIESPASAARQFELCSPNSAACCAPGQRPDGDGTCAEVGLPATWCPDGFLLQQARCVPDPALCGDAPFGDIEAGSDVVFVDASADPGGDGSLEAPFKTLQDGLASVTAGGTVALAAGVYAASGPLTESVRIAGRCADQVILESDGSTQATVEVVQLVVGDRPVLRDVTLRGSTPAVWLVGGGSLLGERVHVDGVSQGGFLLNHGDTELVLRDSVIGAVASIDGASVGVGVLLGATATLERVRIEAGGDGVLAAQQGSTVQLDHVLVQPGSEDQATGLVVVEGGVARGDELTVRSKRIGVLVFNFGQADLDAVTVEDVWEDGIQLHGGSHVVASAVRVNRPGRFGVFASEGGSRVTLVGAALDTPPAPGGTQGVNGLRATDGAELELIGAHLTGGAPVGVLLGEASGSIRGMTLDTAGLPARAVELIGGSADLDAVRVHGQLDPAILVSGDADVRVRGAWMDLGGLAAGSQAGSECIFAQGGAVVDVRGSWLAGAGSIGLATLGDGTLGRLAGVLVSAGGPLLGQGLQANEASRLEATAVHVTDVMDRGLFLNDGASARLDGVVFSHIATGPFGRGQGIEVAESTLEWEGGEIDGATLAGVLAWGIGASVNARGVRVTRTAGSLTWPTMGAGLDVRSGAAVSWAGSQVEQNTSVNVSVAGAGASLELVGSRVASAARDAEGAFGGGVSVSAGGSADLRASVVEDHSQFGVRIASGAGSLEGTVIRATHDVGSGMADALLIEGGDVTLDRCVLTGADRVGLLVASGSVSGTGNVVALNGVGVVSEPGTVTLSHGALFDNAQGDEASDPSLALPDAPLDRPAPPE